jgi:hypothetical protein
MWVRVLGKLMAVFGLYSIVLAGIGARMAGAGGGSFTPGVIELAAVTVLFVVAAAFIITRRPRARPPVE